MNPTFLSVSATFRATSYAALLTAAWLSVPSIAVAQSRTPAAAAAASADSVRLFKEGMALAQKGEFEKAKVLFNASYQRVQNPNALFNLALAERKTKENVPAAEHFAVYSSLPDADTIDAKGRADAARNLTELQHELCMVNLVGPPGMTSNIAGRSVRGSVGYAEPGGIVVELTVGPMKRRFESACKAGEQKVVSFDDVPATAAPAATGLVVTDPGFSVVKVPEVNAPPKVAPETSRSDGLLVAAIGTGALGLGGVVFGGVFGSASQTAYAEQKSLAQKSPGVCLVVAAASCKPLQDANDRSKSNRTLSIVSFVAGGAMLGASALFTVLYLGSSKDTKVVESRQGLRVRVAPTINGLVAFGEF